MHYKIIDKTSILFKKPKYKRDQMSSNIYDKKINDKLIELSNLRNKLKSTFGEKNKLNIYVYDDDLNFSPVNKIDGISFVAKGDAVNYFVTHKNNKFANCKYVATADNNFVLIKKSPYRIVGCLFDFAANSSLFVERNFSSGPCEFRLRENFNIYIGYDNMYSSQITFWTSDGHAILDRNGQCINRGGDIYVGDHVWIGHQVKVLKKSKINDNSVIGSNTLVNKTFTETNLLIAGIPGKIIKNQIRWDRRSPLCFKNN